MPGSKVSKLLNRKEPKFSYQYDTRSEIEREPAKALLSTGVTLGLGFALRRFLDPLHAATDGIDALEDLRLAAQPQTFSPRSQYIIDGLEKTAGVAGGIMSLFPQTRAVGYGLFGATFLYEIG